MEMSLKKFDDELQVVYGEVYAPNVPDAQGDFMSEVEVMRMAHNFMMSRRLRSIDTNHDNAENGSMVVESFIVNEGDVIYVPGAWVVGVYIPDPVVWAKVKSGELNGFSMEALVKATPKVIELEVPEVIRGKLLDDDSGHTHKFEVRFNEDGNFLGGKTSVVDDHFHVIEKGTVTNAAGSPAHNHRYSIVEEMSDVKEES